MFTSIKELVAQAEGTTIGEIMLRREAEHSSREQALADMQESLNVMLAAVHKGMEGVTSHSGMTGGNAQKMHQYLQSGNALTGDTFLRSITYAPVSYTHLTLPTIYSV